MAPDTDHRTYGMRIDHRPYSFDRKEWTTFLANALRSELAIRGIRTGLPSAPKLEITCTGWRGTLKNKRIHVTISASLHFQDEKVPLQVTGSATSPMGPIRATDLATTNLLKTIMKHPSFKGHFLAD